MIRQDRPNNCTRGGIQTMKASYLVISLSVSVMFIMLTLTGCSSKGDILKEVSGIWQNNQNQGTVEIKLTNNGNLLKIDGKSYPITVDKVEMDKYQVNLKVQNGGSEPELWTLREVWNDNGTDFKLSFNHSGKKEILVPKEKS